MSPPAALTASGSGASICGISAAGIVLVREAGGVVSDFQGRTDGLNGQDIVCANEHIHPQLLKLLKQAGS